MKAHKACMFRQTRAHVRCGDVRWPPAAQRRVNVQYSTNPIGPIMQQAQQTPVVELAGTPPVKKRTPVGLQTELSGAKLADTDHIIYPSASKAIGMRMPSLGSTTPTVHQQQGTHRHPFPNKKVRPSRMDFELMYQQLYDWRQQYLSAHVPRYCFDAPQLGAWVRKMRKQYKDQQLEQWKVERLNQLSFEWELTDQDAKWHHLYHQMRRYQLLHGTSDIDISYSQQDACDWSQVDWWLKKQARLLAKQKLSSHKRDMLAQLGVTLRLPKRIVTRTAQLQALNGPERRKLRKKWKKLDQAAADEAKDQREQLMQQQKEQQQLQQEIADRRLSLLRDVAGHSSLDILPASRFQREEDSDRSSIDGTLQQQQRYAQVGLLPQQDLQHQQQQTSNATSAPPVQGSYCRGHTDSKGKGTAAAGSRTADSHSSYSISSRPPDSAVLPNTDPLHPSSPSQQQQQCPGSDLTGPAAGIPQQSAAQNQLPPQPPQQQQQQTSGLLYQRNRRGKRVSSSTKQERWLSANRHS